MVDIIFTNGKIYVAEGNKGCSHVYPKVQA